MTLAEGALDGAAVIELLAAGVIVIHAVRALLVLIERHGLDLARLVIAEGVLAALGFSLAATQPSPSHARGHGSLDLPMHSSPTRAGQHDQR